MRGWGTAVGGAGHLRLRRGAVLAAAAALACGALAAVAATAATAAPGRGAAPAVPAAAAPVCQVTYTVNSDWGTGFSAAITITNNGPAITSWTLGYAYTGNQKIAQGWSGTWAQSGENITVTNASWNGSLATGGSTQIGANFSYTGTNTAPTTFTLNGNTCNGSATPTPTPTPTSTGTGGSGTPMVSITSPTAGEIFTPGSTVTLQASPVTGAGTVNSVTFYDSTAASNNNVIGTATTSPWSVQWANVPAGNYSLTAVASNGTESLTSYPVAITVETPTVVVHPVSVAVQQGKSVTFGVALSAQPSSTVTVNVAQNSGGDPDLSVSSGGTLTFTTSNWSVPQAVTVASGSTAADGGDQGTFSASATGYNAGSVTVTEALPAGSASGYDQWFLNLYDTIMNPVNGYFSPKGIPYHSVETLIVEAPDYGHETTSETYSYYLWLTADYGRVTGNWTPFNNAWANMQQYMIPNDANQPGQCNYNPSSPATYGPEEPVPNDYPVTLNSSVPVGPDPLFAELKATYGNCDMYQPMWIMDTGNRYGFGQQEDGTSTPSWVNSYQRGPEESVWDTIPQPDWDTFKYGGPNGFLDLFNNGGGSFAQQYKYTDAPDADARMVQAAYWADTYAKAQGKQSQIAGTLADAAKLGDFLRYSMFDKYFKQISAACSQDGSVGCPAGTSKSNEDTYLLSWYDAWGGATNGAWAWRISGTTIHEGYQNPLAAYALSTDSDLIPLSPTAQSDWATSLTTQLNLFKWLQSAQGAIAGGVENNWGGNYGDVSKPPSGDPTFDGMYYDSEPEYHNPPSNQWFGYQTWPMERLAEYYYATGNSEAQAILAKWVSWAESVTTINTSAGTSCLPGTLTWSGQPGENWTTGTSGSSQPPANTSLNVSVSGCSEDLGVATSLAKTYEYYAAKSGDTTAETDAQNILDVIHKNFADPLGYSAPETRTDYINFTSAYNTTNYEGVYIPPNWTGKYPGGIPLSSSTTTFLSIRPWYIGDPEWSKVQAYLNGGSAPVFNYHRFWAEVDIATAFDTFANLFPTVQPPAGS
jgi:Glycosyl hydrolase family 48/Cellulose binding domain/Bacterial Ig domain